MHLYLQPFQTKQLLDESTTYLHRLGHSPNISQRSGLRIRFGVVALSGVAQAISYLALWVLSSLACFGTLGLVQTLDHWSDHTGSLVVASLIGTAMALSSIFYLPAAGILTKMIVERVDKKYAELLRNAEKTFIDEVDNMCSQRRLAASAQGELYHPEVHFDPAVEKLRAQRLIAIDECQSVYPRAIDEKCMAFLKTKKYLKELTTKQLCELRTVPFSRKELDKYLVQKIASEADREVAKLYEYCKQLWASRIREWGQKFDREAFCRNCEQVFRVKKVVKSVRRLVRDVKEAESKEAAYDESKAKLDAFLKEIKKKVDELNRPTGPVGWWRGIYPKINKFETAQKWDRWIDPPLPFLHSHVDDE